MTHVLVGTDDGVVPFVDGVDRPKELAGRRVEHLAPQHDDYVAIADRHVVMRRDESGSWHDIASSESVLTCVLPMPGGAWCGTADGELLRLHEGKWARAEAFDTVAGRETWHAVGTRDPYVRSLTRTADDRALLASVHVGGIPRSGNGGASWKPTIDPEADVHQVRAHPIDPTLVVAAAAVGFAVSHDCGATWAVTTEGLHATYLRAVSFTNGHALVTASDGPYTERGALYRWDVGGGGPLERVSRGLPEWLAGNVDTGHLDGHDHVSAFADDIALYSSDDGGESWHMLATDVGAIRAVSVRA